METRYLAGTRDIRSKSIRSIHSRLVRSGATAEPLKTWARRQASEIQAAIAAKRPIETLWLQLQSAAWCMRKRVRAAA